MCKCGAPNAPSKKYCAECHAAYMRGWRITHRLEGEARRRANARAQANAAQRRGQIKPQPCEICASQDVQKHHDDYTRPLAVRWLCKACHLAEHRREEKTT